MQNTVCYLSVSDIIVPMRSGYYRILILLIFIVVLCGCQSSMVNLKELSWYPVTRVVDGDTFWIDDGSPKGRKVRLIGADTPETVHPRKEVQTYGREASDYTKKLLTGQIVGLEFDVDKTDRYGRLLAYVYLKDGTFLNARLIERGYAQVMTVPPNVKYSDKFLKLQRKARSKNAGLWDKE